MSNVNIINFVLFQAHSGCSGSFSGTWKMKEMKCEQIKNKTEIKNSYERVFWGIFSGVIYKKDEFKLFSN